MMFINPAGALYVGDMRPGDREATPEEVAAWEAVVNGLPPPIERIRAIEKNPVVSDAMQRASRLVAMAYAIDDLIRIAASKGQTVTRQQAHDWAMLNDNNYKTLYDAEQIIKPLRSLV